MKLYSFVLLLCSQLYSQQIHAQELQLIINSNNRHSTLSNSLDVLRPPTPELINYKKNKSETSIDLLLGKSFFDLDPDPEVYDRFVSLINEATSIWEHGVGKNIFNVIEYSNIEQYESNIEEGATIIQWNKDFFVDNNNLEDALAITFVWVDSDTEVFIKGNVIINANKLFFDCIDCNIDSNPVQKVFAQHLVENLAYNKPTEFGHFRTVIAHELGHLLGVEHVEGNSSLMQENFESFEIIEELSSNDIRAYNLLYNKNR